MPADPTPEPFDFATHRFGIDPDGDRYCKGDGERWPCSARRAHDTHRPGEWTTGPNGTVRLGGAAPAGLPVGDDDEATARVTVDDDGTIRFDGVAAGAVHPAPGIPGLRASTVHYLRAALASTGSGPADPPSPLEADDHGWALEGLRSARLTWQRTSDLIPLLTAVDDVLASGTPAEPPAEEWECDVAPECRTAADVAITTPEGVIRLCTEHARRHLAPPAPAEPPTAAALTIVLTPDEDDGGFVVTVPWLPGCVSQGETVTEALTNVVDAITGLIPSETSGGAE